MLGLLSEWAMFRDTWRDLIWGKLLTLAYRGRKGRFQNEWWCWSWWWSWWWNWVLNERIVIVRYYEMKQLKHTVAIRYPLHSSTHCRWDKGTITNPSNPFQLPTPIPPNTSQFMQLIDVKQSSCVIVRHNRLPGSFSKSCPLRRVQAVVMDDMVW